MRRLIGGSLALAAAIVAALWFAPRLLDEATLRDRLAAMASERLGRPVALTGPIVLQLLPEPRLEAAEVAIGAADDRLGIRARGLRLTLAVGALLGGRLEPRELVIVGAELRLPWPPATLQELRPPPWLAAFEARLEDSRVVLGDVAFEAVGMRLASGGAAAALEAEGRLAWQGRSVRFSARLGRAGADGAAPLDVTLAASGGEFALNGILDADGAFEGELAATGADLASFVPGPSGAFDARGRVVADAELVAIDPLSLRLEAAGERQTARGAASLRLMPEPRLDLALVAGRVDLDAWIAAMRRGGRPPLPVSLDLAATAARLGGLPVRELRGAAQFAGERLTITDATALFPGDTRVEASGASAGARLELGVEVASRDPRGLFVALGLPPPADPGQLREAGGRFRLALADGEAVVSELDARIDAVRIGGGGSWRSGPRPTLGIGLTVDRLTLDGVLPDGVAQAGAVLAGVDVNLRLAVDRAALRGVAIERAALDAGFEAGRLTLRRLAFRAGGLDVTAAAAVEVAGATPRLAEFTLEASGRGGGALVAALPDVAGDWLGRLVADSAEPILLRASGSGVADAVALRIDTELGPLRLEANGTLDVPAGRATGTLTLRHPGAPRLLAPVLGADAADWLGEGSLAVIATLAASRAGLVADPVDVVAGGARGRGRLAAAFDGARPRLTGNFGAERLPLPGVLALLDLPAAGRWDAELALTAEQVQAQGWPALTEAAATLRIGAGMMALDGLRARLGGGTLEAALAVSPGDSGPDATLRASVADVALSGPLLGWPFDLGAGRLGASVALRARGRSAAALAATLTGEARLEARDGVLVGLDLPAALAATGRSTLPAAEAGLRDALGGGATGFERLVATARIAAGQAAIEGQALVAEGVTAPLAGRIDVARGTLDLRFVVQPPGGETAGPPAVALRAAGPWAAPRRLPELAPYLRWRAEQG